MMKIMDVIMFLGVMVLISCNSQGPMSQQANTDKGRKLISKDIRTDTTSIWNHFHNINQLSRQLKLQPIEEGFDSLQIRIWFDHGLAKKKHLITIERQKNEWKGRLYEMNVSLVDTLNYNIVENWDKKDIVPASNWKQFITELYQHKIQDLSDSSESGADGMTYCVELLTAGTYTYYSFWEPELTKDKNVQSANMVEIIALLQREFKFTPIK